MTVPTLSVEELWDQRLDGPSADPELDLEVWRLAEQEVANGWAVLEDVDPSLLLSCVLSRRFRVRQGSGKVRAIDDFSCSSVNCTLGTLDKITTMSTAHSVSLILRMMLLRKPGGLVERCFDLKSAYRQLAVGLHSLPFAKVAVCQPARSHPGNEGHAIRLLVERGLVPRTLFFDDFTSSPGSLIANLLRPPSSC